MNGEGGARGRRAGDRPVPRPAVWYFPSDYAGLWRRLAVELADSVVLVALLLVLTMAVLLLDVADEPGDAILVVLIPGWAALIYGYLVVLKRSRFRTAGYRLAHVRIVDACGRPPGLGALTLRLSFAPVGPLNVILDTLWIPFDRRKQALRDKLAHTYVVKADAEPAGRARVVLRTHHVLGMSFVFHDVEPVSVGRGERA